MTEHRELENLYLTITFWLGSMGGACQNPRDADSYFASKYHQLLLLFLNHPPDSRSCLFVGGDSWRRIPGV